MPHFIRLRGAWEIQSIAGADNSSAVAFTRRFGGSAGLKSASRVWLCIEDVASKATVELNKSLLGEIFPSGADDSATMMRCPARFDVTSFLKSRNLLAIKFASTNTDSGRTTASPLGIVQLAID